MRPKWPFCKHHAPKMRPTGNIATPNPTWESSHFSQISFEPGFGAYQDLAQKLKMPFFQDFLLISAVLRVQGRFQNPRQTPVRTKLRLKRFPILGSHKLRAS